MTARNAVSPGGIAQNGPVRYVLHAFGLTLDAPWWMAGARPASPRECSSGRATLIEDVTAAELAAAWADAADRIFEPTFVDGNTHFTVDHASERYRLWFDGYGRYLVSNDGTRIGCDPDEVPPSRRARFLFAQAIPLAAVLQGYELFHASAVAGEAGVAAFAGTSGAGKTSLASRLVARGARLVTDDVLAIESTSSCVLAHPGPAFMALPPADQALFESADGRLGEVIGESDKTHVSPATAPDPLPLKAIFYLMPGSVFELRELEGTDPRHVLASAFAPYLTTSDRLGRQLETAYQTVATVQQLVLQIPREGHPPEMLGLLEKRLRTIGI